MITVKEIRRSFGSIVAVDGISFDVAKGEDIKTVELYTDDIESVTVASTDENYTLKKYTETVILENLAEDKQLKDKEYERVFKALTNLRFSDVCKKLAEDEELVFDGKFICRLKDSTAYTISIAQKDDKTYVTCEAEFMDKTPVVTDKTDV